MRTVLQHAWAQTVEKLADSLGIELKYGGGPPDTKELLISASEAVAEIEEFEAALAEFAVLLARGSKSTIDIAELQEQKLAFRDHALKMLSNMIKDLTQ